MAPECHEEIIYTDNLPLEVRQKLWETARMLHNKGFNARRVSEIMRLPYGTVRDWLYHNVKPRGRNRNETKVDLTKTESIAYLAGVIHSDGWLCKHGRHYEVHLASKDLDFISAFVDAVNDLTGKRPKVTKRVFKGFNWAPLFHVCIVCKQLFNILKNPDDYIAKNPEAYIRGFADGDGSIRITKKGHYMVLLYNNDLNKLKKIKMLLSNQGISSKIRARTGNRYVLGIYRQADVKNFMEKIGFSIRRKQQIWRELN